MASKTTHRLQMFRTCALVTETAMTRIWDDKTRRYVHVGKIVDTETHRRLPSLTLAQYMDAIAEVPLPTAQQREDFVEYVSHAHSWYKHLGYNLPGVPFYFFVDKYAGWDRVAFRERTEQGPHYSQIPTEQYRTRFGHLAYSPDPSTTPFLSGIEPVVLPRDPLRRVWRYGLPAEILEAGLAHVTAVIHVLSACYPFWNLKDWPKESGGQAAVEKDRRTVSGPGQATVPARRRNGCGFRHYSRLGPDESLQLDAPFASRSLRWTRKTGQVAKRESCS